jgi:mono/diheme cytochrome c family protein
MRGHGRSGPLALGGAPAALGAPIVPAVPQPQQADHPGKPVYDKWCAGCHGVDGRGAGPAAAYMLPRPRDFTKALYQIRTTSSGSLPTDGDILHVINRGMPGRRCPAGSPVEPQQERENLVSYLKTFSRFFETDQPQVMEFGRAPSVSDERLAEGAEVYRRMECFRCHGDEGRGDGPFPRRPCRTTRISRSGRST